MLNLIVLLLAAMMPDADAGAGLSVPWPYNGVNRPLIIEVAAPGSASALSLVLMNPEGDLHTDPVPVTPGRVDLADVMPDIWRLRRAGYLQLLAGEEPIGPALVLQPMLTRMVPVAVRDVNPNGLMYTRIVDWYDELHPPADEASREAGGEAGPERGADTPAPLEVPSDPWLAHHDPGPRLLTGLRVYRERDVILHTSEGGIRLAMRPDEAPNTVWSFLHLCEGGFYRGVLFHRVVPMTLEGDPFVIQAGDPTATGGGGPGYWLPIEPSALAHDFGVISMARDVDPDSAGSQFFICLSREGTRRLDGHYCAFGYAVDGADAIRAIAAAELADLATGRPALPPVIDSVDLVPSPPRRPGRGRPDAPVEEKEPAAPETRPARIPR